MTKTDRKLIGIQFDQLASANAGRARIKAPDKKFPGNTPVSCA